MYSTTLVEFSLTSSEEAKMELEVLGFLGKKLTGPTMKTLYTSAKLEIHDVEGIEVVRQVLERLKVAAGSIGKLVPSKYPDVRNRRT